MGTRPSGRSLDGELLRQAQSARLCVGLPVVLGVLLTAVTVAQMIFLYRIIDRVFLKGAGPANVRGANASFVEHGKGGTRDRKKP